MSIGESCCHCGDVDGALKEAVDRASATADGDSDPAMLVTDECERADNGDLMDTGKFPVEIIRASETAPTSLLCPATRSTSTGVCVALST